MWRWVSLLKIDLSWDEKHGKAAKQSLLASLLSSHFGMMRPNMRLQADAVAVFRADALTAPKNLRRNMFRRRLSGRGWRFGQHLLLIMRAVLVADIVFAAPNGIDEGAQARKWFNIPSQPLVAALQAYGADSGVQVLYESDVAAGRRSVSVEGNFSSEAALRILLSGTDLAVHYTRPDAITLTAPSAESNMPPAHLLTNADLSLDTLRVRSSADTADETYLHEYSGVVQSDIQSVLRKNDKTRSGHYQFGVKLWVDSSRIVRRTEFFRSTGDRDRDAAVVQALQGLVISRAAPANTPQPVHVMVVVKSLQ
jgi:Secretin and TonB N terminus short domain